MFRIRLAFLAAAALIAADVAPLSADEARAAEYFALAQAAEKRSDWQVAISNYERAYKESPHPDTLFNIALNYERLGRNRDAARFLARFGKETKNGDERAKAEAKIKELRDKAGRVTFLSDPPGATILLDDKEIGKTPLERQVDPGTHTVVAVTSGSKSQPRKIAVEFGEPISIDFRVGAKPGRLTVRANVKGAEVVVDGVSRGPAPFSGTLPAGKHTVLVAAPGYRTVSRDIDVPSEGSEQITAKLTAIDGGGTATPAVTLGPIGYLLGFGFGLSSEADADASARGLVEGGIRTRSQRWDFVATYGSYGGNVGFGFGAAARVFLGGASFRPYVRGALAYGRVDDIDGESGSLAGEGGIGVRYIGKPTGRTRFSIEYFIEINFQLASANPDDDDMPAPMAAVTPVAVALSFPLTLGIAMRFGGRR